MRNFFIKILLCLLMVSASSFAYNFKCKSRNGWAPGNGRYSYEGEWIDYYGVKAKAGEFVLFYYPHGSKGYWFYSTDCYEI